MSWLKVRGNVLGFICLVTTAVIFLAGLWPFDFSPENKVRWLRDQNGVRFYGQSLIYSNISSFQSSTVPGKSISIEICLQSVTEETSYLGHIFSFLDEHGSETFFICQWRSHLLLGKGTHGKKNYREMGIRDVLRKGDKRFVTVTSGVDGTTVYVDGALMKSNPKFRLFSINEKPSGRIVLGNSPGGNRYWTGNLFSLAIYDRALTGEEVSRRWPQNFDGPRQSGEEGPVSLYLFDEHSGTLAHDSVGDRHLAIPPTFKVLKKAILVPPWEDFRFTRSYLMDILTNILGFIPFGFFLVAYLRVRKPLSNLQPLLMSVLVAGFLSLSIELIQVCLPTRNSQLTDVITNLLGTAIGSVLFQKIAGRSL